MLNKGIYITLIISIISIGAIAQNDTNTDFFKPKAGLGIGNLTFFGDVGNSFAEHNPLVSNIGYSLTLGTPINNELTLSLNAIFGKLTVNERSLHRNLNFQTEIRGGGLDLSYNFKNILGDDRVILPYISVGVASIEFLSKTDLYNSDNQMYNYWSDGTIRNLPQDAPNAFDAEIITQDYIYESDLREMNIDGYGDYKDNTMAFPVGAGIQFRLNEKVEMNIGAKMYLTQTDLIDNVTGESKLSRKGDAKNDRFLFSSVSLTYNFNASRKNSKDKMSEDLLALGDDGEDDDLDGVSDLVDRCPTTPANIDVDEHGCPVDSDHDGVPDYTDKELDTRAGMEVNTKGIGLDDKYFMSKYINYNKMIGEPNIIHGVVESTEIPQSFAQLKTYNENYLTEKAKQKADNKSLSIHNRQGDFRVVLGSTSIGINNEQSQKYLSVPDIETIDFNDSTYYVTKSYSELEDAVMRQMQLMKAKKHGEVVEMRGGKMLKVQDEFTNIQNDIMRKPEDVGYENHSNTWRVQLGAFRNERHISLYDEVQDLLIVKGDDGLTRYLSGAFKNPKAAADHKINLLMDGFKDAFLTVYKDGKRINVNQTGLKIVRELDYDKLWKEESKNAFDKSAVEFRIKLTESKEDIPTRLMNKFIEMGDVETHRENSMIYYLKGHYKHYDEAKIAVQDAIKKGIIAATIVGSYQNSLIPASEAKDILDD